MHLRKLLYLVLVCVAMSSVLGVELVDGTNVWVGAASGGSWTNPANWRAESRNGYSVEELFARYTVYDLRALAPGAVVNFDYADGNVYNVRNSTGAMFISGIILSGGPDDVWTIARSPEAARVHFTSKADICIGGGRLDFHPLTSTGCDYPTMPLVKKGTGTFRLCQNNAFFWEVTHSVQGGCVSLTNNYNLLNCGFRISNGARLAVDFGSNAVAGVSSDAGVNPATTRIDIAPDATLDLMSGFNVNAMSFGGDLTGTGKLRVSGGKTYSFTHGGNSNPLSFAGALARRQQLKSRVAAGCVSRQHRGSRRCRVLAWTAAHRGPQARRLWLRRKGASPIPVGWQEDRSPRRVRERSRSMAR